MRPPRADLPTVQCIGPITSVRWGSAHDVQPLPWLTSQRQSMSESFKFYRRSDRDTEIRMPFQDCSCKVELNRRCHELVPSKALVS